MTRRYVTLSGERGREANSFGVEASLPKGTAGGRDSSQREECQPDEDLLEYTTKRPERLPKLTAAALSEWLELVTQRELHHARTGEQPGVIAERARVGKRQR